MRRTIFYPFLNTRLKGIDTSTFKDANKYRATVKRRTGRYPSDRAVSEKFLSKACKENGHKLTPALIDDGVNYLKEKRGQDNYKAWLKKQPDYRSNLKSEKKRIREDNLKLKKMGWFK